MNREERQARISHLENVIRDAEKELLYVGAGRSISAMVEQSLADLAAGEDFESKGIDLCGQLVAGLNALNEHWGGEVALRSDSATIATDVGAMTYDVDSGEWYFVDRYPAERS